MDTDSCGKELRRIESPPGQARLPLARCDFISTATLHAGSPTPLLLPLSPFICQQNQQSLGSFINLAAPLPVLVIVIFLVLSPASLTQRCG